ncbi:hypothetical protein PSAC2689_10649 [Paraburkholderia sacchari]|uniref:hypothetical protein n=1 Tax=Paraburkholderia sacchari TaxID=159450 RepID=UPI0039A45EBC
MIASVEQQYDTGAPHREAVRRIDVRQLRALRSAAVFKARLARRKVRDRIAPLNRE